MNLNSDTLAPPLTPQVFYILVAISYRSLHAYAIVQQVAKDSGDNIVPTRATVHDALKRLIKRDWIEVDHDRPAKPAAYQITANGRHAIEAELRRLKRAILVGELALTDGRFITT
jgi:DNA-binding PadR family transcriptional regulator